MVQSSVSAGEGSCRSKGLGRLSTRALHDSRTRFGSRRPLLPPSAPPQTSRPLQLPCSDARHAPRASPNAHTPPNMTRLTGYPCCCPTAARTRAMERCSVVTLPLLLTPPPPPYYCYYHPFTHGTPGWAQKGPQGAIQAPKISILLLLLPAGSMEAHM
jgi:hypothetical protein